ncbi:MAG TPA: 1-phosphofructokinase family hexose kinase [Myxococcaceae bacterium]|nr:1-phosphofructokinase family hexose kinase [Myxococcaceae bacterium]
MPGIATLTLNPTIDESTTVDHVVPEHKLRCAQPTYEPGGGGLNVSRAIRNLGGESVVLWTRGGPAGQLLSELLEKEGLRNESIPISGFTRTNFIVLEMATTLQYRFGMPGPELTEEEAERCLEAVRRLRPVPDYLVVSGSLPPGLGDDFCARVAKAVPASTRVVVDTSGEPLRRALEAGVYLVKPNLRELGQSVGRELRDDPAIEEAARELVRDGRAQVVVVSVGAGGALVVSAEGLERVRSPTVPIKSKVGAGDSMVGGMVLALSRGLPLREVVRYGVSAGAGAVMTAGTELCRREDVERLYAQMQQGAA